MLLSMLTVLEKLWNFCLSDIYSLISGVSLRPTEASMPASKPGYLNSATNNAGSSTNSLTLSPILAIVAPSTTL